MPRPPRFNISAIADLLQDLRYAPSATRKRELDAAEMFVRTIDPAQNYPVDFVVFSITAYRPEVDSPALLIGEALIRDLVIFIELLSASLAFGVKEYEPRVPLAPSEVEKYLNVSTSTVYRYRKQGLVAHRVRISEDKTQLIFFKDAIDWFRAKHSRKVKKAQQFTRIDAATHKRLIHRAKRYRESANLSLHDISKRLARKFDRSKEAIRLLLLQYDQKHPEQPIFQKATILNDRESALILRAHDMVVPVRFLTQRLGKNRVTIHRHTQCARVERLRQWELKYLTLSTFLLDDAEEILLSSIAVTKGFPTSSALGGEAQDWVDRARQTKKPIEEEVTAWFGAMNYLLYSVDGFRRQFDQHHPSAAAIDVIETRMRWSTILKQRILNAHMRTMLATLEVHITGPLLECPGKTVIRLHQLVADASLNAVQSYDPSGQQPSFALYLGFRLRQILATAPITRSRAKVQYRKDSIVFKKPKTDLQSWEGVLGLPLSHVAYLGVLSASARQVIDLRFGLQGDAPLTCVQIAQTLDKSTSWVTGTFHRGLRQLKQQRVRALSTQ